MGIKKNRLSGFNIFGILGMASVCLSKVAFAAQGNVETAQNKTDSTTLLPMAVMLCVCLMTAVYFFIQYRKKQKEVQQIFYYDVVSQLPNKAYMSEYISNLSGKAKGYAYIMITIDDFEKLNSLFGQETREFMYQCMAESLSEEIEESEILCSISDSTYGLLLKSENRGAVIERFVNILRKIEETSVRDETSKYSYHCKFYGGIYEITGDEKDFDEIFNMCSLALAKTNHQGNMKYQFFDDTMQSELKQKKQLMADIEDAFEKKEIKPYFQPQYDVGEKTVCGAEMLARWEHPTFGLIRATEFIPLLEVNGKVLDLDLYIFEEACKQIKKWVQSERMPVPIWINVFQQNLYETKFIDKVFELSKSYGVPQNLLGFEIRANLLAMENMEILETIQNYHERGFLVCVDRFEPSSPMSILYNYPLDRVKITSEYLELAKRSARVKKGLQNLISFSRELNISACGKGVQTKADEELLEEVECEAVQGDFYGDACDMKSFEEMIF
ncbi:MAG: GGDEF domain-containing protein [Lachnospiraceae bacterium]|nr:GGDEF domain-containing protein [Lachnospiraceae bacterium]